MLKIVIFIVIDRQIGEYFTYQSLINQRDLVIVFLFRGGIYVERSLFKYYFVLILNICILIIIKIFSDEE